MVAGQDARAGTTKATGATRSPGLMLAMATIGFAVNFWAWALISPLGPLFREKGTLGALSESDVALMVAVPVIVGSLGRIMVGALTDKLGGRVMFPLVSVAAARVGGELLGGHASAGLPSAPARAARRCRT